MAPPVFLNTWAVLGAAALTMVIGSLWYGPFLGKAWMKAMGMDPSMAMTPEKKKAGQKAMMWMAVLALVSAYVLAHFVQYVAAETWLEGAQAGFWLWLGFQMPLVVQGKLFESKKTELIVINGAYQLVALLAQGALLAVWVV
jgi:hypothetical protein